MTLPLSAVIHRARHLFTLIYAQFMIYMIEMSTISISSQYALVRFSRFRKYMQLSSWF